MTIVYTGARLLGCRTEALPSDSFMTHRGQITWVGRAASAPKSVQRVSLDGRTVTPGFVDGHAHLTMTGLMLGGIDLHGIKSAAAMVRRVADYTRTHPDGFVYGSGWDDTAWPEPPTARMIERAAGNRHVYLSRIDAHSALVSRKLFAAAGCEGLDGGETGDGNRPTGIVRRDAHHAVRRFFFDRMPLAKIRDAHRTAAEAAVAKGITTAHEMSGPLHAAGERDLDQLLKGTLPINVVCYYASEDMSIATGRGLRQIGGDMNADGSLGSRTAALSKPYADMRGHTGFLYRDATTLGDFFEAATRAGLQAGVHCIGDAGCEAAVAGLERAAKRLGVKKVRAMRHRLEHFEMATPAMITRAAALGAVFSVQPAFDAHWGGPGGMYAARLGVKRALPMNNIKAMHDAGTTVGFGSDCPVTPFDPLAGIKAATEPSNPAHAIALEDAFHAATTGAASMANEPVPAGLIAPGHRADFVVWESDPVRSTRPAIRATVARGTIVYGMLGDCPSERGAKPRASLAR